MPCDTSPPPTDPLVDRLFALLIAGDDDGATQLVDHAVRGGATPSTLMRDTFIPLLRDLQALRRANQMTLRAFTMATTGLTRVIARTREAAASRFVSFHTEEDRLVARFAGPHVGEREAPIIHREIMTALEAWGPRLQHLTLDLSDVRVISSMALGMCLDVQRRAIAHGARITIHGADDAMQRVLSRLAPRRRSRVRLLPWRMRPATAA